MVHSFHKTSTSTRMGEAELDVQSTTRDVK